MKTDHDEEIKWGCTEEKGQYQLKDGDEDDVRK